MLGVLAGGQSLAQARGGVGKDAPVHLVPHGRAREDHDLRPCGRILLPVQQAREDGRDTGEGRHLRAEKRDGLADGRRDALLIGCPGQNVGHGPRCGQNKPPAGGGLGAHPKRLHALLGCKKGQRRFRGFAGLAF